jgi:predicted dehydrogenase
MNDRAAAYSFHSSDPTLWIMVGYSMRYSKPIRTIADLLIEGAIGSPVYVAASVGQYLPDWHPGEDYRTTYMYDGNTGGGALLDLSHEVDYLQMLFGPIDSVVGNMCKFDTLPMKADNLTDLMVSFENEMVGYIHMDLLSRDYNRTCRIVGDKGTIGWDYSTGLVGVYKADTKSWTDIDVSEDRNDMYLAEMKEYLWCLENGIAPYCGYREGMQVMKVVYAAMDSEGSAGWEKVV